VGREDKGTGLLVWTNPWGKSATRQPNLWDWLRSWCGERTTEIQENTFRWGQAFRPYGELRKAACGKRPGTAKAVKGGEACRKNTIPQRFERD